MVPWAKHPEKMEMSAWGQWKQLDSQLLMSVMDISSFKRLRDCIASVCNSCYVISAHRSALGVCPTPL